MDFFGKDKLSRLDEERQRRRQQRADEALRRLEEVGKQTQQLLTNHQSPQQQAPQTEATDASGRRPGGLSRVLFETATGGGRGGKPKLGDPRQLLNQGQAAMAQITGAMDAIQKSVVDATGAGLRGGLEEASKSVTDVVDRVASMASGTIGTLSPSANKNPLAQLMQEEQAEESAQTQEADQQAQEDHKNRVSLDGHLETMKHLVGKKPHEDKTPSASDGRAKEEVGEQADHVPGTMPHEAADEVQKHHGGIFQQLAGGALQSLAGGGNAREVLAQTIGQGAGIAINALDPLQLSKAAENAGSLVQFATGAAQGAIQGATESAVEGLVQGDFKHLGKNTAQGARDGAIESLGETAMGMLGGQAGATLFNAATMVLDPANAVGAVASQVAQFSPANIVSNVQNALDPKNLGNLANAMNPTSLVAITGQAIDNITNRLHDVAAQLDPKAQREDQQIESRDPVTGQATGKRQHMPAAMPSEQFAAGDPSAAASTMPQNAVAPRGDGSSSSPDGSSRSPDGTTKSADGTTKSADGTVRSPDGTTKFPDGTTKSADGTTKNADGSTTNADGSKTNADGSKKSADGSTTNPDGTKVNADGSKTAADGSKTAGGSSAANAGVAPGQLASKSGTVAGATQLPSVSGTVPNVAKTPTPGGPVPIPYPNQAETAAKSTAATAANATSGQAAPQQAPTPGTSTAPASNKPAAERAQAVKPSQTPATATGRSAAQVSGSGGGPMQVDLQPVSTAPSQEVNAQSKEVTQPNVTINARGESPALPGMPADLAKQGTPASTSTPTTPTPATAPSTANTPVKERPVTPLPAVTPAPTPAAKGAPPTNISLPQPTSTPLPDNHASAAPSASPQPKTTSGATTAGAASVPANAKAAPSPPASKIPPQTITPGTAAPQTPATTAPEPNIPPVRAPGGDGAPNPSGMVPETANLGADRSNAQQQLTAEAQTQGKVGPEAANLKQSQVTSQEPAMEQTKRSGDAPREQAVASSTAQGQTAAQAGKTQATGAAQSGNTQINSQAQGAAGERAQYAAMPAPAMLQQTSPSVMQSGATPAQAAVAAHAASATSAPVVVNPSAVARANQAAGTPSQLPPFDQSRFNAIDQMGQQPLPETNMAGADQSKAQAEQTYQQANTQIDQLSNIQAPQINAPSSQGAGTTTKDGKPTREAAIANVEQRVTQEAQAQGPAKMQEAANPLQQEVRQTTQSAQQAATTSAQTQLQDAQQKGATIRQQPPPITGQQAAQNAQPEYQSHQAEATTASQGMQQEIAGAQTTANQSAQQAKAARDQQVAAAQAQYQANAQSAQTDYAGAQQGAKQQFDQQNQAAQQSMASEQQAAQQAATQQTQAAQQKADADIAQQQTQLAAQQQAANTSHQQQMEAANQQHQAQMQQAQAQSDADVASKQSEMQSQVASEQQRGQTEVNQHLTEGEQGYQREIQSGEQQAAAEKAKAEQEARAKEQAAQAEKDKHSGGVFGKVVGWVKDRFNDLMNAAKAVLAAARDLIVSIMEKARAAAIAVLQKARQAAQAALAKVKSAIQGIISAAASAIRSIISACAQLVRNLIQNLANMLKSLVQALTTLLTTLVQAFQAAVNALLDGLILAVSMINKDLGDKLRSATQKYRDAFNNAMTGLQTRIKAAGDALQAKIQQAADGAIAVVNAAEQNLNAAVTRVETTLNAAVEAAYQKGKAAIDRAFDAAEAVVNKAFDVAEAAVKAYFDAQIAALDIVQQAVDKACDFVVAVADKVLEAVAKIAEAIVNLIPESWTKWFVDFWNGPWRQAIIIGLATVAAVAITVATCGAAGPVAMILIAGLIGGTIAGTAYAGGEILAREGEVKLSEDPSKGIYVPGVGYQQIKLGADGKPVMPEGLTEEQQQAWEKNSKWAVSNFNTQRDAEGNVTGYERKSGAELANYAVEEGMKGFGEGFISSAGAMGGSLAGGAVAGLGVLGRVASNPIARQMISTLVESGVGVVSQSVGAGWTAGFEALADGKNPAEAFGAAWKAGSEQMTDPGNWVAALAQVGVVPIKTKALTPLLEKVTGRVGNQLVKTGIKEGTEVVFDTMAQQVGSAGGSFVGEYKRAIDEGKSPAEALERAKKAANDQFKPEAIFTTFANTAAGQVANKHAERYAQSHGGGHETQPAGEHQQTTTPDPHAQQTTGSQHQTEGQTHPTPDGNPRTHRGGDETHTPTHSTTEPHPQTEVTQQTHGTNDPTQTHRTEAETTNRPIDHAAASETQAHKNEQTQTQREGARTQHDGTSTEQQPHRNEDGSPIGQKETAPHQVEDKTKPATTHDEQTRRTEAQQVVNEAKAKQQQIEEMPPLRDQIDKVTGVEKGPQHEAEMQKLRDFYRQQEIEAQQVTRVTTDRTDQMLHPTTGQPHFNPDGTPYGYGIHGDYDVRRFNYDGQNLTQVTIKVHLEPGQGVTAADIAKVHGDVHAGVDRHYNNQHNLPNGDRLNVRIEFVTNPADAHLRVDLGAGHGRADQTHWFVSSDPTVHAHELGHQMGLLDEYHDTSTVHRNDPRQTNVRDDNSLMGNFWHQDSAGNVAPHPDTTLQQRHLDQIHGDIESARAQQQAHQQSQNAGQNAPAPSREAVPGRFQDRPVDQARVDQQMQAGHSGIEVHSHFMGNVEPEGFHNAIRDSGEAPMQRAKKTGGSPAERVGDISSYEPVMREIAGLKGFSHETAVDPATGEMKIKTRGRSGDAIMQIEAAQARINELKAEIDPGKPGDPPREIKPERRREVEALIEKEARSAVEKALRASDETDFNSSYEVRDELVKKFYGSAERSEMLKASGADPSKGMSDPKAADAYREHFKGREDVLARIPEAVEAQAKLDADAQKPPGERMSKKDFDEATKKANALKEQVAYDAYAKETILRLAQDGITYTEQSNSINKLAARFDEKQIAWLKAQLVEEHPHLAKAINDLTIKHVTMINTNMFGVRDPNVSQTDLHEKAKTARGTNEEFTSEVNKLVEQTKRGDVVGVDIAGAEHFTMDAEGVRRLTQLYDALATEATTRKEPIVLRPHVGEGANDVVPGEKFHRDGHRQIVDSDDGPKLSHYARAEENLKQMVSAFEAIANRPENGGKLPPDVIVRFGHATHTTPELAARMAKLGIIAEVNLTSNIETGSVAQRHAPDYENKVDHKIAPGEQQPHYEIDPAKRGGTLDDHSLTTLIAHDVPIILSTDAHAVMNTNMANEYARAKQIIDEVVAGRRTVEIDPKIAKELGVNVPEGATKPIPLTYGEMPPALKERFDNANRKLYEDANRYFDERPKQPKEQSSDLMPPPAPPAPEPGAPAGVKTEEEGKKPAGARDAKPPATDTLKAVLDKAGKSIESLKSASSYELEDVARGLLAAKGVKNPSKSQLTETVFKLSEALKSGKAEDFTAPYSNQVVKLEDGVNERLGNIFGEKKVFDADKLTHERLKLSDSERTKLEGGYESGAAGMVMAASFINAPHRAEGDFSRAYGDDAWRNFQRANTYLDSIPKGKFVDGLNIDVMVEVNRLIHTPDTGMKAEILRTIAMVGRGFRWDKGGDIREGKQYARPEHYTSAEIANLREAGIDVRQITHDAEGGGSAMLKYPNPEEVKPRLDKLIAELRTELAKPNADPIAAAAQFQRHFVALHPFGDSNGRTSRALMNRILADFDMPPAIFADQNRDMSLSPKEWRDEVAKGVARSKDFLSTARVESKDEYITKLGMTPLDGGSKNKPITIDGFRFDLGADGLLYDPTGRPHIVQNGEIIPLSQMEHFVMSRRVGQAGNEQGTKLLEANTQSTRDFFHKVSEDPDAAKGVTIRDDARARKADEAYRLNPEPEVAQMLTKLTDVSALDPHKMFQIEGGAGRGTTSSAILSKYTQMDLEFWYVEKGLRDSKNPELVDQLRQNRAKLFEMAKAELAKAKDASRVSPDNPEGFRYRYEKMMYDTSPLRFGSFDEAIHELGDKRMTVWRGDYSFARLIGMAPNNDVRQPDAKQVSHQRAEKAQLTNMYDDLVKLEGSAVGRQYICTTSDLALLAHAFANSSNSQSVNLSSLPAPVRERLLGWMDPSFPDGTTPEQKAAARKTAMERGDHVVPTDDGGKEIRDVFGIPGTILKLKVTDKKSGQVQVTAERKAFRIDIDKDALLPGIYSLGGPSFESEQELHGLEAVRPWKIKGTHTADTIKEEFPVTTTKPADAPAPATPADGGGVGFGGGGDSLPMGVGEGQGGLPQPAAGAQPASTGAKVESETEWDAADGSAATRTTIGVGERVFLTADADGSWSATAGTRTGSGQQFTWTAPGTASPSVTITFTPTGGTAVTKTFSVIEPAEVKMESPKPDTFGSGTMGAGFVANVVFHPLTVSFAATEWKEDTGQQGQDAKDYFVGKTLPVHAANPNWLGIGAKNSGPTDHAAFSGFPSPWTSGSFKWSIQSRWKLRSASAGSALGAALDQVCTLEGAPHAGRTTVTKGGSSATRSPNGTGGGGGGGGGQGEGIGYADGPPTSRSAVGDGFSTDGASHRNENPSSKFDRGVGVGFGADGVGVGDGHKAGDKAKPVDPEPELELPDGRDWAPGADGWSALIRTSWLNDGKATPTDKLVDVLTQLQRLGAYTWAKPDGIRRAAEATKISSAHAVIQYNITLRTFAMMGLPPLASTMVAYEGGNLLIALKVPGVTDDQSGNDHTLAPDESGMVTRAIEAKTNLKAKHYVSAASLIVREGIVEVTISDGAAAKIFGKKEWEAWKKSHANGASQEGTTADKGPSPETPTETGADLSLLERARVEKWMSDNLGVADTSMATHIDRTLLNVIDEIEANPDLKPYIRQLVQKDMKGPGQPAHTFALQELLERAKYEKERNRLGIADPAKPDDGKAFDFQIPVKIVEKGDIFSGRSIDLRLEWDWTYLNIALDLHKNDKQLNDLDDFVKRHWKMEVDWAFERTDKQVPPEKLHGQYDHSDVAIGHTFKLDAGEKRGLFLVHAFIRTSHLAPIHITAPLEVKTESARMEELRADAMGDMMGADTQSEKYEFDLHSITQDLWGGSGDTNGTKFTGNVKDDFQISDPAQRAQDRADEMDRNKKMIEYLKLQQAAGSSGYQDAINAAEQRQKDLEEADKKIKGDEASGWRSFELRGTYLSRNGEVPSGPLTLYGFVKPATVTTGTSVQSIKAQAGFAVRIRDLSNKLESDLEYNDDGVDFQTAFRNAFLKICKSYPEGKMTLLAEDQEFDANGQPKSNGKTVGFELATTSEWKRIKAKVFDPAIQIITNAAAMALMIIFPPSATVILPMLAFTDIVNNVDDMIEKHDRGDLTLTSASIDLLAIGLDLLPFIRGAKFLNPAKTAIQEAKGMVNLRLVMFDAVQLGGQFVVMYERTREQLANIQEKQIGQMAEKYRALIELENQDLNTSDPNVARLKAEIEQDAENIRATITTTWTNAVANQATFFVGSHLYGGHEEAAAGQQSHKDTHFEADVPASATKMRKTAEGTFETGASDLRTVHAHYEKQGARTSEIQYDPKTKTAHFELTDSTGTMTRVEAPVGHISKFAELHGEPNRVVGHPVDAAKGMEIIEKLNRGDASGLADVGIADTGELPHGVEFGLGELPDGTVVVVLGEPAAVDWAHLPGMKPKAHTHPSTKGNDLPPQHDGTRAIPLQDMLKDTPDPLLARELVFPSGADIIVMAHQKVDGHVVVTEFVIRNGMVTKAGPGDHGPRMKFTIVHAERIGEMPDGRAVYKAKVVGESGTDRPVDQDVWVIANSADDNGSIYMKKPADMVESAGGGHGTTTKTATQSTPGKQWVDEVRNSLATEEEKAAFDGIVGNRSPEAVMNGFKGDRETARNAAKKAAAKRTTDDKFATTEKARIQQIRDFAAAQNLDANPKVQSIIQQLETGLAAIAESRKNLAEGDTAGAQKLDAAEADLLNTARGDLRTLIMGGMVNQEISTQFPNHPIHRDVQVWAGQDPKYKTQKEFRDANPDLFQGSARGTRIIDGRIYLEITDVDFLVLKPGSNQVVHAAELKTGANDTHGKAAGQLQAAKEALQDNATHPVVLLEGGTKNITKDVDLSTFANATRETFGPAGKSFDEPAAGRPAPAPGSKEEKIADVKPNSLQIRAEALEDLIGKILDELRRKK